ncbi:GNAT family N-acetyltransferase [Anseongella ginsenosidimutans]|nr:GNAT family N-acetyltransferase [Anseongella ginsenosidimutans]QEC52541.1 GNAT family N-acetyltransferase [Anseongella ginsenosidimutans]
MNKINIRSVTKNDVMELQKIARETFFDTFSAENTKENMEKYLAERLSVDALVTELNNADSEFYFAEADNKVAGYLKINVGDAQTELQDDNAVEIERIYVLKAFQGKRVGQSLCQKAIDIARQRDAGYVWLGVWEENHKAVAFYKKNGFVEFGKHSFKLGDDEQMDVMMKLELNPPA